MPDQICEYCDGRGCGNCVKPDPREMLEFQRQFEALPEETKAAIRKRVQQTVDPRGAYPDLLSSPPKPDPTSP